MDWNVIAAVAEMAGAAAVLATLLYLTKQVRLSTRQNMLEAFQHTYDSLNAVCQAAYQSPDMAAIILRGRSSYRDLSDAERFRFDHFHIHLLNIIESHHYQVRQTAVDQEYRRWTLRNLELIVQGYLAFPGTREFWEGFKDYVEPNARDLVSKNVLPLGHSSGDGVPQ